MIIRYLMTKTEVYSCINDFSYCMIEFGFFFLISYHTIDLVFFFQILYTYVLSIRNKPNTRSRKRCKQQLVFSLLCYFWSIVSSNSERGDQLLFGSALGESCLPCLLRRIRFWRRLLCWVPFTVHFVNKDSYLYQYVCRYQSKYHIFFLKKSVVPH